MGIASDNTFTIHFPIFLCCLPRIWIDILQLQRITVLGDPLIIFIYPNDISAETQGDQRLYPCRQG